MKRIFVLLFAVVMVISLGACNKDNTASDTDTSSDTTIIETSSEATVESEPTESTVTNSSSESSIPTNSSSEPTESSKPATSSTPSASTPSETKCNHKIKYTFDNIPNTWSHSGECTLCKEKFDKKVACADKNKDNKCDDCSAKMDFGTAYQNANFIISWRSLNYSNTRYDENPVLTAETVFMETRYKTKEADVKFNYFGETYYYSAAEFEKTAKSLFNIDDAKIAEMRLLQQERINDDETRETVTVYDSATKTYSYMQGNFGGGAGPDYLGYKKISDTEYAVYINDTSYDYVKVINCTYTDTVKISGIYAISSAPTGLTKFK